jgi:hypothetical protein
VHFGAWTIKITDDMGHASLVAKSGREMNGFLGIILWEGFDLSAMASGTLSRQETQRAMTRSLVLLLTTKYRI